jgi:GMP synthase (glutamine-hydrolysing)
MTSLRIHYLQHVPFEGLGFIADWAREQNASVSCTKLFLHERFPAQEEFDWLIILGGPMNVYEDAIYPWLPAEKAFIKEAITRDKVVLGICLGAQLIADVLGGKISANKEKEIGWFPVSFIKDKLEMPLSAILPDELNVMHWHGDTFTLPLDAIHLATSRACANQGFIYDNRVFALQFHLETTKESLLGLIKNCGDEIRQGDWIQPAETITARANFSGTNTVMGDILNFLQRTFWAVKV